VLTDTIDRREAALQARVDRLHALRVGDPSAFAGTQLARVTGDISASVTAVIEHASVHLRAEVAALQQDWIGSVARAGDGKALDAALERIAGEWHARPQRIADEFRVLVMGGLAGSARDIFPVLGRPLVDHGLPEEHLRVRVAPVIAPIPLLPSLLDEPPKLEKAGWLAGLFKSFDARRSSIREKAHERIERLRERADAELLDAEPLLHDAIRSALAHMFDDAAAKQQAWLDAALAAERTSVAVDRLALAPLVRVRDTARRDGEELAERITRLERDQPAVSVAAAAAATASLSR
ncbi:MAG TPA: hypothetical protein VK427_05765, partial [Kofleriaceae bacterium]|nr:hypothetical protein [Kofleriaceae bacterium]